MITCFFALLFANAFFIELGEAALGALSGCDEEQRDDVFALMKRDLSPDNLATSVPVAVTSNNEITSTHIKNKDLVIRSSSHKLSGIGGYTLHALPILSADLTEILKTVEADLVSRDDRGSTSIYHVNTTRWSFSVLTANNPVPYTAIKGVLHRYVKLATPSTAADTIVSTRVGVLYDGSTPIADINIFPSQRVKNGSFVPFPGFDHSPNIRADPNEFMKITPFGSTCAYELVNQTAALAPFRSKIHAGKLKTRQLEGAILAHIGQTGFAMTMNLWRQEDGLPVEVKIWALQAIVCAAFWQLFTVSIFTAVELSMTGSDDLSRGFFDMNIGLDTGLYSIGHLVARLVVTLLPTVRDPRGLFTLDIWREILEVFMTPLQGLRDYDDGWAMEGKIFRSRGDVFNRSDAIVGTADRDREYLAAWQIYFGDIDDFPY